MNKQSAYKFLVIADTYETIESKYGIKSLKNNDHYSQSNIATIVNTINLIGYNCEHFGGIHDLVNYYNRKHYASNDLFLNFSDGLIEKNRRAQAPILLEMINDKYLGSDPSTILLVSDKHIANVYASTDPFIKTPKSIFLYKNTCFDKIIFDLNFPVIIKPNNEGSSAGIAKTNFCQDIIALKTEFNSLISRFDELVVEEYIAGEEITVFVIGNGKKINVFPLLISINGKTKYTDEIMDWEVKHNTSRTYFNPLKFLSEEIVEKVKVVAERLFNHFRMRDIARFDLRINEGEVFFIEANTVPNIAKEYDAGEACRIYNWEYKDFIDLIIQSFLERID
ncbi:MAG: hypothetical protein R3Y28_08460 [Candidatus Gastranaerophilales bacterium]